MTLAKTLACACLAVSFAAPLATAAHADDAMMKKDGMKKDGMKKEGMMKKDDMKKDSMMKGDAMKKDSSAQ